MSKTTTEQDGRVSASGGGVDAELAEQLVARARSEGLELTGPGGLLQQDTKTVLEGALEGIHRMNGDNAILAPVRADPIHAASPGPLREDARRCSATGSNRCGSIGSASGHATHRTSACSSGSHTDTLSPSAGTAAT